MLTFHLLYLEQHIMIPRTVILDTHNAVKDFKRHVKAEALDSKLPYDYFIDDVLHELIGCIANREMALQKLNKFAMEIHKGEGCEGFEDGMEECFALPVYNLGMALYDEAKKYDLYGADDELLYHHTLLPSEHFNDVVLRSNESLD